ncbi:MAG: hypothetical protein IPK80_02895, partial [Nannocystis sp.]|nr:hypothetical protein [Nannocystis sp.]
MAVTFTWEGSTVATTRSSGAVWTVLDHDLPGLSVRPRVQRIDILGGEREIYDPLPDYPRPWSLTIKAECSGMSGSSDEGKTADAWAEAAAFFAPLAGVGWLGSVRVDAAAAAVSRRLRCNVLEVPPWQVRSGKPGGLSPGAYPVTGAPYIVYVASGDTRFPFYCGTSLLTADTSAAAAELAVSGSTDTVTINN